MAKELKVGDWVRCYDHAFSGGFTKARIVALHNKRPQATTQGRENG